MLRAKIVFSALLLLASSALVSASSDGENSLIKQNNNGTESVAIQSKFDYKCVSKDNGTDSSGRSVSSESPDSFELLDINQNDINKEGVLKELDNGDWNFLLGAIKKALYVKDKPIMRIDKLQDAFSQLIMKYPSMTLFDFQNGIFYSVGQYLDGKNKPLFSWEGNIDFQKVKLPENPNMLLLMESKDNDFMGKYFSYRENLKSAFEEFRVSIKKDKEKSTHINLIQFKFIFLDNEGKTLKQFEDFASKMVSALGSTAKPYIDRGIGLYDHVKTFCEKEKSIVPVNSIYQFETDVEEYLINVLADPRQEIKERSFKVFDHYKFTSEIQTHLQEALESFYTSESEARRIRLKLKN